MTLTKESRHNLENIIIPAIFLEYFGILIFLTSKNPVAMFIGFFMMFFFFGFALAGTLSLKKLKKR